VSWWQDPNEYPVAENRDFVSFLVEFLFCELPIADASVGIGYFYPMGLHLVVGSDEPTERYLEVAFVFVPDKLGDFSDLCPTRTGWRTI